MFTLLYETLRSNGCGFLSNNETLIELITNLLGVEFAIYVQSLSFALYLIYFTLHNFQNELIF